MDALTCSLQNKFSETESVLHLFFNYKIYRNIYLTQVTE